MFAKLHHQQGQQQTQQNFHQQPSQPQHTFHHQHHHPFHVSNTTTTTARECQTSEEADSHSHSHQSRSPTTVKKETNDGATIEVIRRPRGRPPGSKNKPKPPVIITRDSEPSMSPYVLEISAGVDIIESVLRFCRKRCIGLCILNGSGAVTNVTLRQPSTATPGSTVTFHGRFDILSISATILQPSNTASSSSAAAANGLFTISLAGPQGQVFGGAVVGPLASAATVFLIAATFSSPAYQKLPLEDEAARNSAGGGGNEGRHHSPPGGGSDSGHPPAAVAGESAGMAMYSCHLPSDVIWTPTPRQPPPPPPQY